jgi:nitric-oxide synthase
VPAISNMRLSIGGINYPLAPFNGWYLGTEIGARNLADSDRYNLVPLVARAMGLDTSSERSLWRDRALVELNRAVLWSFDRAGARISDHHTESRHFLNHVAREERAGRPVPADWSWIVPPISGGATAVFHRYYAELDLHPNFYLDADAVTLSRTGRPAMVRPAPRPIGRPPMQQSPGQQSPGQHGPGQHGPGQHGPGQHGPGQHGPGQSGPGHSHPGKHSHHQPARCPSPTLVPGQRLPLRPAVPSAGT